MRYNSLVGISSEDSAIAFGPKHDKVFISNVKPHKPVSKDTVARWLKNVLAQADIDVAVFKPHSTRAASASHLKARGNPLKT